MNLKCWGREEIEYFERRQKRTKRAMEALEVVLRIVCFVMGLIMGFALGKAGAA